MSTVNFLRDIAAGMKDCDIKKAMVWAELELGERADHIFELEDEVKQGIAQEEALREALCKAKAMLEDVCKVLHSAAFQMPPPAVDMAPFTNVMAAHGVEPYAKRKRSKVVS